MKNKMTKQNLEAIIGRLRRIILKDGIVSQTADFGISFGGKKWKISGSEKDAYKINLYYEPGFFSRVEAEYFSDRVTKNFVGKREAWYLPPIPGKDEEQQTIVYSVYLEKLKDFLKAVINHYSFKHFKSLAMYKPDKFEPFSCHTLEGGQPYLIIEKGALKQSKKLKRIIDFWDDKDNETKYILYDRKMHKK